MTSLILITNTYIDKMPIFCRLTLKSAGTDTKSNEVFAKNSLVIRMFTFFLSRRSSSSFRIFSSRSRSRRSESSFDFLSASSFYLKNKNRTIKAKPFIKNVKIFSSENKINTYHAFFILFFCSLLTLRSFVLLYSQS